VGSSDSLQHSICASTETKKSFFTRPLRCAIALTIGAGSAGIILGLIANVHLQKALYTGSVGFIFGGLLTAVVKILVEDHAREREKIAAQAKFTSNVLNDLKSVYDRVERARIVIAAHQSALTYGTEMRDLIDSRVQLRNITRALDNDSEGFSAKHTRWLRDGIRAMESYLEGLTDDFVSIYLDVSKAQSVYEAKKKRVVESQNSETCDLATLKNKAWPQIAEKLHAKGFIRNRNRNNDAESFPNDYKKNFEDPLDMSTWVLLDALRILAGHEERDPPSEYSEIAEHVLANPTDPDTTR
jgi:hypothetical protein